MNVTIHNRAADCIYIFPEHPFTKNCLAVIDKSSSLTISLNHLDWNFSISKTQPEKWTLKNRESKQKGWTRVSRCLLGTQGRSRGLRVFGIGVTLFKVEARGSGTQIVVLSERDLSAFLGNLDDSVSMASLCLPGTHDTLAFYGWPVSQCQSKEDTLLMQLNVGIRILDIRMAVVEGRLIAYHGIAPQRTPFSKVLAVIHSFLVLHPTETLVMSIKQEDFAITPPPTFSSLVRTEIYAGPGGMEMWFLQNRIPKLGEVRGKVIMLSRFGGDGSGWHDGLEGLGIHPSTWPDSAKKGFSWYCKETFVRTHDWYSIPSFLSIPEKVALSTEILFDDVGSEGGTLNIAYLSAASIPFALPSTIAKGFGWPKWGLGVEGVNSRVERKIIQRLVGGLSKKKCDIYIYNSSKVTGWIFMDFFSDPKSLVPLLVELNFIT